MAARLLPDFPKLSYRLIGMTRDKSYRAVLEQTIRELNVSNHVSLIHSAPEALKFATLRDADVYIQPSHEEGFCIAYLEAAMLVPKLVGTDTGAIAAMAEGDQTARVVKPGDVAGMEAAARELIGLAEGREGVPERRQRLAERYSWEAYLEAHLGVYSRMPTRLVKPDNEILLVVGWAYSPTERFGSQDPASPGKSDGGRVRPPYKSAHIREGQAAIGRLRDVHRSGSDDAVSLVRYDPRRA